MLLCACAHVCMYTCMYACRYVYYVRTLHRFGEQSLSHILGACLLNVQFQVVTVLVTSPSDSGNLLVRFPQHNTASEFTQEATEDCHQSLPVWGKGLPHEPRRVDSGDRGREARGSYAQGACRWHGIWFSRAGAFPAHHAGFLARLGGQP